MIAGSLALSGASFAAGWKTGQTAEAGTTTQRWTPPSIGTVATTGPAPDALASLPTPDTPPATVTNGPPSLDRRLELEQTITGPIRPKSVAASSTGLVLAQNMMYEHTITAYRADGSEAGTISDEVDLASFGIEGHPGVSRGAPVEAAFTPDGRTAYVSNYSMYGAGFGPEGSDMCSPDSAIDPSFVYRIDAANLAITGVIPVGTVPKYVRVTPDSRFLLVSNWCSWDLSVVDLATQQEVRRVPLDAHPRGIAVDPSSGDAYVAVMGADRIARIDLGSFEVTWIEDVGAGPRDLAIDPGGAYLHATLNGDGQVVRIDLATGEVVARATTGDAPRSMAISPDGQSLYVVNYESDTVTKLRALDLAEMQTVGTRPSPIGITFEPTQQRLWVADYTGAIEVFADR